VELRLTPRPVEEIKTAIAQFQSQRKAAQPTNKRTFGSVFENPRHELTAGRMLEACGLRAHRIGGAQISPMHANFIENAGGARSADAVALMTEARRRAHAEFGVELRHEFAFSACRSSRLRRRSALSGGEVRCVSHSSPRSAAREAVARLPPAPRALKLVPSGRSVAVSLVLVVAAALLYLGARETPVFAVRTIDVEGVRPSVARRVEMALRPLEGESLLKVRSGEVERLATALPSIASETYDLPPRHVARAVEEEHRSRSSDEASRRGW
jgi:hypothetical protein